MRKWIALALLASGAALPQEPTFKAGTDLVEVDVVVRDKKGAVEGLTKDNFTLLDNGKPQKIEVFTVRSASKAAQTATTATEPLPPGAVSNRVNSDAEGPGTNTVLLMDQKNTLQTDQAYAIQRIAKFIEMRRKNDRIAIYAFGRDGILHAAQDLTEDNELLSRAAKGLKAQDPNYRTSDITGMSQRSAMAYVCELLIEQETDTKHTLEAIARHLAKVPGRKSLIWLTVSFPLIGPDHCVDFTADMERLARTLNDANVALYAADARGLMGALSGSTSIRNAEAGGGPARGPATLRMPPGVDTMNLLAGRTGGDVYLNTNGLEDSMRTAMEDADLTYALGFYPAQEAHDRASHDRDVHSLKVKVDRPGVSVRHRENYSALNAAVTIERPTMQQLMEDSLDATQIGLSVETAPDQVHAESYQLHVSVDLRDMKLEHQGTLWTGEFVVALSVEGSKSFRAINHKIEISENQLAASLEKRAKIDTSIMLDAPAGILRVVTQDQATGAAGSVRVVLGRKR